jgi:hypothetical protein
MISFGFKRSCPLVGITQRRLPRLPVPRQMGQRYEIGGAPFRRRWGTITTAGRKVPHFPGVSQSVLMVGVRRCPQMSGFQEKRRGPRSLATTCEQES